MFGSFWPDAPKLHQLAVRLLWAGGLCASSGHHDSFFYLSQIP